MPVTVSANNLTVVHASSMGITQAFPDVCKTPAPPAPSPIPIPYPNIAMSQQAASGATKVKADGNPICTEKSNFSMSTGDEAGVAMGIMSNKIKGKAEFLMGSFDVKAEGKAVVRAMDMMFHNEKNTPPFPLIQPPLPALIMDETPVCLICDKPF
jgi:hypothetical protein